MPQVRRLLLAFTLAIAAGAALAAQRGAMPPDQVAQRLAAERELHEIAVVDRKIMMPMRDGVRLATDIYRPKGAGPWPTIFVRTPYNFNFWDVANGVPGNMTAMLTAVKRGYAYVIQNERGHYFSEGHYDILGTRADGVDRDGVDRKAALVKRQNRHDRLLLHRAWQMGVAGERPPAFAAMNIQGHGAG